MKWHSIFTWEYLADFALQNFQPSEPRGEVRVRMVSDTYVVDINGPNTCEILNPAEIAALTKRIGPDVLRKDADPDLAFNRIAKSKVAIGQLLMDQSVIGGIGNIYRTEILWRQNLHPLTTVKQISRTMFDQLWADSVHLLEIGVKNNAIITVDRVKKSRSKYGERVNIFDKPTCLTCNRKITKIQIATRRIFACEACQPI